MRQARPVHLWDHTPDEIRNLPIDALALLVLEAFGPERLERGLVLQGSAGSPRPGLQSAGSLRAYRRCMGLARGSRADRPQPRPKYERERSPHDTGGTGGPP